MECAQKLDWLAGRIVSRHRHLAIWEVNLPCHAAEWRSYSGDALKVFDAMGLGHRALDVWIYSDITATKP